VWTFPQDVENHIEDLIEKIGGTGLHAPCGISKLGKKLKLNPLTCNVISVDLDPTVHPDIVADIFNLKNNPYIEKTIRNEGGFDFVISDPVWLKVDTCPNCKEVEFQSEKGIAYPLRRRLSYSVRDVLKPGGVWIFNGLWNPEVKGLKLAPFPEAIHDIEMIKQYFNSFRNLSLLMCLKG
jgi:hypothetical protein